MDPPRPLFVFDLNEIPPPDDGGTVDASPPPQDDGGDKFDDASTTALGREPSPEDYSTGDPSIGLEPSPGDDVTADASQADYLSPSQQMLDLDAPLSPMYDDEDDEYVVELDPLYEAAVACSPAKMTSGGRSPVIYHHAEVVAPASLTARPYCQAGVDMATPARPPSYFVDIHGSAAPFSPTRHGGRTSRPNSETKPPRPPSDFPVRSSSTSASRVHAGAAKGASDTSSPSSHRPRLKRRLSVPRDDSAASDSRSIHRRGSYDDEDTAGSPRRSIRRSPPAYPARHRERSRRNNRAPPTTRDQQAPRRNAPYEPSDGRDRRGQGHRGHEKRQGYPGDGHPPRGYAKPKFPVQEVCFDPYGYREDSYGGRRRQIPSQEAPNGGYHQYWEPPRGHFPASFNQRCHPYVSAGYAFDGTKKNPGNQRAMRHHENRPNFPASFKQRCHPYVSVDDDAFDGTRKNPGNQRAVRDENRPDQHRRRRDRRQYYEDPYSQSSSGLS